MFFNLFWTLFKIGLFTFGGGYAMIAGIREQIVEKKNWLDDDELTQIIAIAESTPGPIAINMATYVGYKKGGVLGAAMATLGVVMPSLAIIFTISLFLDAFMANKYVAYAFVGIKAAVACLIIRAGWGMLQKVERKVLPMTVFGLVFALLVTLELLSKSLSAIVLILCGGIVGIAAYGLKKEGKK